MLFLAYSHFVGDVLTAPSRIELFIYPSTAARSSLPLGEGSADRSEVGPYNGKLTFVGAFFERLRANTVRPYDVEFVFGRGAPLCAPVSFAINNGPPGGRSLQR